MRKALPDKMFLDDQSRLSLLRNWVLDNAVTEIEMSEKQFWNFAQLQPVVRKAVDHIHGPDDPRHRYAGSGAAEPRLRGLTRPIAARSSTSAAKRRMVGDHRPVAFVIAILGAGG